MSTDERDSLRAAIIRAKCEVMTNCIITRQTYGVRNSSGEEFLTKEQLARAINVPSTRMVDGMARRRMIPYTRLGHRTVRFQLNRVREALQRFEVREKY